MNIKVSCGIISYALLLLGILECILRLRFAEIPHSPVFLGWIIASLNFIAAVISSLLGLKKSFKKCMWIVLGGSGIRMALMIIAVIIVMQVKNKWLMPFSLSLLGCFVMFLIVEVGLIYRHGIREGK